VSFQLDAFLQIPRKGKVAQTDKVQCYEPATMKYLGYFPALTPDEVCSWPAILGLLIDVLMFSGTFFLDLRMVGECSSASLMWLY
jgi:hypothetical protein